MSSNLHRWAYASLAAIALFAASSSRALAIPIFAQRYHLACEACHSVIPELNSFGHYFRQHGYQLPLKKHGTTVVALRYQLEWEKDPVNSRRFTPGAAVLANADLGKVSAFVHYSLGAQGGPGGLFLGYLATYNEHTRSLYRFGLIELPLVQSPGQRLDDLQQYGYYGAHVGLNDLPLSSPRWGLQVEKTIANLRLDVVADGGEFKGAAYGGAPSPTGETTAAAAPELGIFARETIGPALTAGASHIAGTRRIVLLGKPGFTDNYDRTGTFVDYSNDKVAMTAEQWWGNDGNADGFGTRVGSSGGYVRVKYYVTPHSYLGVRYDATANPFSVRDFVYYGAFMITPHARLLIQNVRTIGGSNSLGAAVTVGLPWPSKL